MKPITLDVNFKIKFKSLKLHYGCQKIVTAAKGTFMIIVMRFPDLISMKDFLILLPVPLTVYTSRLFDSFDDLTRSHTLVLLSLVL